jgi:hypothetical protein
LEETGIDHPGRDEVLAAGETDWLPIVTELTAPIEGLYYQKHMAHHLVGQLPRDWIGLLCNVLLIRDPFDVLASYTRRRAQVAEIDIGLIQQNELFDQLEGEVPVLDAADFLRDPEGHLRWLCTYADIEFMPEMLEWPPGPRDSDGVWAKYWYSEVIASTGFVPYRRWTDESDDSGESAELRAHARALATKLRPHYERLHAVRIML